MKIIVYLGKRSSDKLVIDIEDPTDAVEIYNKAKEATGSDSKAYLVLEKVNEGKFEYA